MAKSVHQLHMEAMVVDTHCDTPLRIDEEHADLGVRSNEGHNDFIRMKEISLTYDLPQSFVKKLKLSSASVKLQGTNLFLIYADKNLNGQDPEFYNSGGVALPVPKQFTFTLRLGI